MPLSFVTACNVDIRKMKFDVLVSVISIDADNDENVLEPPVESIILRACEKFLYMQDLQAGKIKCDTSKWQYAVSHSLKMDALSAEHIIPVSVPTYKEGANGEEKLLRSCYVNALDLAKKYNCKTIILPLIASDRYSYPKEEAIKIAFDSIRKWLTEYDMDITLLVLNKKVFTPKKPMFDKITNYINNYYEFKSKSKYKGFFGKIRASLDKVAVEESALRESGESWIEEPQIYYSDPVTDEQRKADITKNLAKQLESSFSVTLMKYIEVKGYATADVYKKANIDRKLFSKIRNEKRYLPSKRTAIALAVALELTLSETEDLLKRAGFSLSRSLLFDVIIEYFITHQEYDIYEINNVLFSYDQPILGG